MHLIIVCKRKQSEDDVMNHSEIITTKIELPARNYRVRVHIIFEHKYNKSRKAIEILLILLLNVSIVYDGLKRLRSRVEKESFSFLAACAHFAPLSQSLLMEEFMMFVMQFSCYIRETIYEIPRL